MRLQTGAIGARLLTGGASACLVAILTLTNLTAPLDNRLYLALAGRQAIDQARVTVVAVDTNSLVRTGAWPWPRRTQAALIDALTDAQVQAIGLDWSIGPPSMFDPAGDAQLAAAIRRNGAVVLPVYAAALPGGGQTTLLPPPDLVAAAAALGHAQIPVGRDERGGGRLYQRAGPAEASWPALEVALRQLGTHRQAGSTTPLDQDAGPTLATTGTWRFRQPRLLRPPALHTDREWLSAGDVLSGAIPRARLRGRIVLLGSMLPDAGQNVRPPGSHQVLASVQWHAMVLSQLLSGSTVGIAPAWVRILAGLLLVQLPLLLPRRLHWRGALWQSMLATMAGIALLAWALLAWTGWWLAPLTPMLVLALGLGIGLLMGWRRAVQRLQSDPQTGLVNRERFATLLDRATRRALRRGRPLCLLLLEPRADLPAAGQHEQAAQAIAHAMQARAGRPGDIAARLDGGRFALLLPDTAELAAAAVLATLQVDLAVPQQGAGRPASRTPLLRSGLAALQAGDQQGSDLLLRATRALVAARGHGEGWPGA